MAKLFVSYSHKDEELKKALLAHLAPLEHEGLIEAWHDRELEAGDDFNAEIGDALERAEIILFLVSSDFLTSGYVNKVEIKKSLDRRNAGQARVIPIILRACDWRREPFGPFLAAPTDGKPITLWPDRDVAYLDVVTKIRTALTFADLKSLGPALDATAGSMNEALAVVRSEQSDADNRVASARDALKDIDANLSQLVSTNQATLVEEMERFLKLTKEGNFSSNIESDNSLEQSWKNMVQLIEEVIQKTMIIFDAIKADRSDFVLEKTYKSLLDAMNAKIGILGHLRKLKPPFDQEETDALNASIVKFETLRSATSDATDKMSDYIRAISR